MIVVSNSSPLISLAKIGAFDLLRKLYGQLVISAQVYAEVVVAGAELPGVADVSHCPWIEVREIRNPAALEEFQSRRVSLGLGEISAMLSRGRSAPTSFCSTTLARASLRKNGDSRSRAASHSWRRVTAAAMSEICGKPMSACFRPAFTLIVIFSMVSSLPLSFRLYERLQRLDGI